MPRFSEEEYDRFAHSVVGPRDALRYMRRGPGTEVSLHRGIAIILLVYPALPFLWGLLLFHNALYRWAARLYSEVIWVSPGSHSLRVLYTLMRWLGILSWALYMALWTPHTTLLRFLIGKPPPDGGSYRD